MPIDGDQCNIKNEIKNKISKEEVMTTIKSMKNGESTGLDGIKRGISENSVRRDFGPLEEPFQHLYTKKYNTRIME